MYLEADVLYAHLKPEDWLKVDAERVLAKRKRFVTSAGTVIEIEIVSLRDFGSNFSLSALGRLRRIRNLEILPLTTDILEKAVELRKAFTLGIFDSIHAAVCLSKRKKLVSTDPIFDRVKGLVRIDPRHIG